MIRILVLIVGCSGLKLNGNRDYVPGSDGTYAQNYQDVWMVSLAQHNGWDKHPGFFLDLGAFKGLACSNTAKLERELGWDGICVEPFPENNFEMRKCVLAARALSNQSGEEIEFTGAGQGRKATSLIQLPKVLTISIKDLLNCVKGTTDLDTCSGVTGQLSRPIPNFINFASLDVEGKELEVLQSFPWSSVKVGAWVVENNVQPGRTKGKQDEVRKIMREHGYLQTQTDNPGVDEYYVLPQYWHDSLAKKSWRIHPPGSGGC